MVSQPGVVLATLPEAGKLRPRSSFRGDSHNLDLIRAVAVLSVFFGHLFDISTGHESEVGWHFAQMGVLIFFVHTSMVLMLSLERSVLRFKGSSMFAEFYLRRFFRLYPLSIFCVLAAFLLAASPTITEPVRHWTARELATNLSLTTNLTFSDNMVGGLWTLPLEVQMYLFLPFLFLFARFRPIRYALILWALSIPLAILQPQISGRLNVLGFAPCFISGVIAWRISRSMPRRFAGAWWPLAFVAVWPVFVTASRQNNMLYRWAFCLALALIIPLFQEMRWRPLNRTVQTIAKYSYGIYLSHIAVMLVAFGMHVARWESWAVVVLLAPACPVAMYHLIEHPCMKIGQRISARFASLTEHSSEPRFELAQR